MAEESLPNKYKVVWSEEDQEFVGTNEDYPSLSWLAKTEEEALKGIYNLTHPLWVEEQFSDNQLLVITKYGEIAEAKPSSKGQKITVKEAKEKFGVRILEEILDRGSALINKE